MLAWWGVLRTQADNKQLVLITLSKNHIKYLIFITIIKLTVYIIFKFAFFTSFFVCEKRLNLSHCYLLFTLGI